MSTRPMRGMLSVRAGTDRQGELQGGLSSVEGLTAIVSPVAAALVFSLGVRLGGPSWGGAPFLLGACTYVAAALALLRSQRAASVPPGWNVAEDVE